MALPPEMSEYLAVSPAMSLDGKNQRLLSDLAQIVHEGSLEPEDVTGFDVISAEREVAYFVRKGNVEALMRLQVPSIGFIDPKKSFMRYAKDALLSLNTVCLHAAIDGGLSLRVAFGLGNSFLRRIEGLSNKDDLLEMAESRIIPLGYCMFVRELAQPEIADKDIVRALRYIHEHHNEKVTVGRVAEHVGLSPEHLSAKFKKLVGQTVNNYIVDRRVEEAKALLRFSNYSISEIAGQLCFSSQSYFQTVFKKKTGVTPQQYRKGLAAQPSGPVEEKANKSTE